MTIDKPYLQAKIDGFTKQLEGLKAQAGVFQGAIATCNAMLKDLEETPAAPAAEAVEADRDAEWNWDND